MGGGGGGRGMTALATIFAAAAAGIAPEASFSIFSIRLPMAPSTEMMSYYCA